MKSLLITIVASFYCISIIAQTKLLDSLAFAGEKVDTVQLALVFQQLEDLVMEKVPALDTVIDQYSTWAKEADSPIDICRASFLYTLYADKLNRASALKRAEQTHDILEGTATVVHETERASLVIENTLIRAKLSGRAGDKEKSVTLGYEIAHYIDSVQDVFPDLSADEYHFKNYHGLASRFLFDNDAISTRYADSAIVHATRSGDPDWMYSAYSMKYYTRYYHKDAKELDQIADHCISLANQINSAETKGEAYMHKCNALVELDKKSEAENYCLLAELEYGKLSDSSYLASTLHNMGNIFKKVDDTKRALKFYQKALGYRSKNDPEEYYNTSEALANELFNIKEYKLAADVYHGFSASYYQYYQEQLERKFAEADAKYQSSVKDAQLLMHEAEIEKKESSRLLTLYGGVFTAGLLLALLFGYYQYVKRREQTSAGLIQAEKQKLLHLEELTQAKTDFFNNISHEIRTPLTLIQAPLKDALTKVKNIELKKDLHLAYNSSLQLQALTDEILELSRLDAGQLKVFQTQINLDEFLSRIFHSFESYASSRQIQLEYQSSLKPDTMVVTDIRKVEKILNNLIYNAIKYSKLDDVVVIEVQDVFLDTGKLEVTIRDTGVGIPADELPFVFDRYYQSSITPSSSGTGIGLAYAKELAVFLNGDITVQSQVNEGTAITLTMPVSISHSTIEDDQMDAAMQDKGLSTSFQFKNKPTVLIVEDHPEMAVYLQGLLSSACEVILANTGLAALEILKHHQVDLISSDIMMPEMDGLTLKQQMNASPHLKEIPFIFLSARAMEDDILKGLKLGVDDYVAKPFSPDEYRTRVFNLIKNRISRAEVKEELGFEDNLINQLRELVQEQIADPNLKVSDLAEHVHYSVRQLNRILKRATGLSLVEFILEVRLLQAREVIRKNLFGSLSEVRYSIGIESASYFSVAFKNRFGISPNEFLTKD